MPVSPVQPIPGNLASTPMAARENAPAPVPTAAPAAAASSALSAAASAVRVTVDDKPLRPVTPTSMRLYLMRVPLEKLASAYDEIRNLVPEDAPRASVAGSGASADTVQAPEPAAAQAVAQMQEASTAAREAAAAAVPAPARADVPQTRNLLDVKI